MAESVSAADTFKMHGTGGDLIFMGPPGVGKGTQAKALAQESGWIQLSTGELFRDHIRRQTELGRRVKSYLDKGEYVPDDVTVEMVRDRVDNISPSTRVLFDGFPRTVAQAEALDRLLAETGRKVGAVLMIEAPREELYTRLSGRATVERRTDDTPEVIANRLDVYDEQTRPLLSYYEDRGLVKRVNGVGAVKDITARLREALE
ncbi:MAG: adenylate kinase [Candidatus Limnocylindria bacterium]